MEGVMQCQSCGMPLGMAKLGTNADGTEHEEYCEHCYQNGKYVHDGISIDDMLNLTLPYLVKSGIPEAAATSMLKNGLPMLKRWQ